VLAFGTMILESRARPVRVAAAVVILFTIFSLFDPMHHWVHAD
jgi:hypothetical protein